MAAPTATSAPLTGEGDSVAEPNGISISDEFLSGSKTCCMVFTGPGTMSFAHVAAGSLAHLRFTESSMTIGWTEEHQIEDDQDAENQGSEQ